MLADADDRTSVTQKKDIWLRRRWKSRFESRFPSRVNMTLAGYQQILLAPTVVTVGRSERFANYDGSRRDCRFGRSNGSRGTAKEETGCGLLIVTVIITSEPRKRATLSLFVRALVWLAHHISLTLWSALSFGWRILIRMF